MKAHLITNDGHRFISNVVKPDEFITRAIYRKDKRIMTIAFKLVRSTKNEATYKEVTEKDSKNQKTTNNYLRKP